MEIQLKDIQQLAKATSVSGGTSLVTYYVPSNSDIWLVTDTLNSELSTAQNIKNKTVRKGVISALRSAMYQLKAYTSAKAPENGLVLCAGEIKSCL